MKATCNVSKLLADLPREQRELIRLKFQERLSYAEIGRITGRGVGDVSALVHTTLRQIRRELGGIQ